MTDDDMTPAGAFDVVASLVALAADPKAAGKRLEELRQQEASIKRGREELAASHADLDRKQQQIERRILDARTREFQANMRIDMLRGLLEEYEKTGQRGALPDNFEAESAELIEADEAASTDWVAAAEQRAAAAAQARGGRA
jgi:hypothetical protein